MPVNPDDPRAERPEIDRDYVLCECELEPLERFVEEVLEPSCRVEVVQSPTLCLTMVRAADSVEHQEFYLGEALTTVCEVVIDGETGYGVCLGDEPIRAYCLAAIDALVAAGSPLASEIDAFVDTHDRAVREREQVAFNQTLRTRVDFKLMDQF